MGKSMTQSSAAMMPLTPATLARSSCSGAAGTKAPMSPPPIMQSATQMVR